MKGSFDGEGWLSNVAEDHVRLQELGLRDPEVDAARHDAGARARLVRALVRVRASGHLTQREVAGRMKTTQSAVSDLEKGVTDPRLSTLQRYARAINCRLDLELVEDAPDSSGSVWSSMVHFRSWKNRSLPYNYEHIQVRVEEKPRELLGSIFVGSFSAIRSPWKSPSHIRHPQVRKVHILDQPGDFLSAVSRG